MSSENETQLKYDGIVDVEMFVSAQRLHVGKRLFIPWAFPVFMTAFIIVYRWEALGGYLLLFAPVSFAIGCLFPLIYRWWIPNQWRKAYRQSPHLSQRIHCIVTADGFEFSGENSSGSVRYSTYLKMKEDDSVVLLYYSPGLFQMIPRGLFSSDHDWLRAKEIIRSGMARRA